MWKEANQIDFGLRAFCKFLLEDCTNHGTTIPLLIERVFHVMCTSFTYQLPPIVTIKLECWTNLKMIVTCSKSSDVILFLWLDLDSHVKKFFFKHIWAPSNSQYIGLKDKFTNNCVLVKEREVERKWSSLDFYPMMAPQSLPIYMALTYAMPIACWCVVIYTYIHTRIWLHMKPFIKFVYDPWNHT